MIMYDIRWLCDDWGRYLEELDVDLDLMVYFASCGKPSKYGSWGLIEAMDQPREEAYKYQAVQDFDASGKMGRGEDRVGKVELSIAAIFKSMKETKEW